MEGVAWRRRGFFEPHGHIENRERVEEVEELKIEWVRPNGIRGENMVGFFIECGSSRLANKLD
jgi:hypothetical protein